MNPDINADSSSLPDAGISEPDIGSRPACRPWGPWATIGLTIACFAFVLLIQLGLLRLALWANPSQSVANLVNSGFFLALSTLAGVPFALGCVWLLIAVRRCPLSWYLALRWPERRAVLVSIGLLVPLLVAGDLLAYLLGQPIVPRWIEQVYRTADSLALLLLAIVVAAPLVEETLMRGFLFRGIADSRLGPWTAVTVSAVFWAALHVQYELFAVAQILVFGIYLGAVRYLTDSVPLTMVLHAVANIFATAEVAVKVHFLS